MLLLFRFVKTSVITFSLDNLADAFQFDVIYLAKFGEFNDIDAALAGLAF